MTNLEYISHMQSIKYSNLSYLFDWAGEPLGSSDKAPMEEILNLLNMEVSVIT